MEKESSPERESPKNIGSPGKEGLEKEDVYREIGSPEKESPEKEESLESLVVNPGKSWQFLGTPRNS